jgi:dTDP-4-dehydrorhamnose 3,5-epimerase
MKREEIIPNGPIVFTPEVFEDERGYFMETYNNSKFDLKGINWVQGNQSLSKKGVFRGIHFQTGEHAQDKLVTVTKGKVVDYAVDLRVDSVTFGRTYAVILSEENKKSFFVPKGFGHGFLSLEDDTIFNYNCSNYYSPEHESGILPPEEINLRMFLEDMEPIISDKDKKFITLDEYKERELEMVNIGYDELD